MSIPEKLITATENVHKVFESGKNSMVDESKLLPTTVSGNYISLDDVSEIPHEVKCKISGIDNPESVTVTRCGKNMLKYPHWHTTKTINGITFTDNGDGTVTANGTATADAIYTVATYKLKKGITYTFSGCPARGGKTTYYLNPRGYNYDEGSGVKITPDYDFINEVEIVIKSGTTVSNLLFKPQWELGDKATDYEPYNGQTLTPSADGTIQGMTSASPYMNIFPDANGVNIEATYNKSWGMQTEYDRFWDVYQENGSRTDYKVSFSGLGWNNNTFKPKYDIFPTDAYMMFRYSNITGDLVSLCEKNGINMDFSKCISLQYAFAICKIARVGAIQQTGINIRDVFSNSPSIETIDKFIVNEEQCFYNVFDNCNGLKNIIFEGIIGNSINFQWSPLTRESITNIIEHLSDTATEQTVTFKNSAKEAAFTDEEWAELIATKPNWNISLV